MASSSSLSSLSTTSTTPCECKSLSGLCQKCYVQNGGVISNNVNDHPIGSKRPLLTYHPDLLYDDDSDTEVEEEDEVVYREPVVSIGSPLSSTSQPTSVPSTPAPTPILSHMLRVPPPLLILDDHRDNVGGEIVFIPESPVHAHITDNQLPYILTQRKPSPLPLRSPKPQIKDDDDEVFSQLDHLAGGPGPSQSPPSSPTDDDFVQPYWHAYRSFSLPFLNRKKPFAGRVIHRRSRSRSPLKPRCSRRLSYEDDEFFPLTQPSQSSQPLSPLNEPSQLSQEADYCT